MRFHQSALRLMALGLVVSATTNCAMAQQAPVVPAQPQIRTVLQPANLENLRTSQVLGIPTSHCGHVIDLLMHNRLRQQFGHSYGAAPQVHLPHLTAGITPGDLELVCVNMVCDGDVHTGPIFQIGMRNNSSVPIGNFRVSMVGVLGQIHVHSPTATIHVPRMEAGTETQIQVQLPVTCMSLGLAGQQSQFDTLIVALDSYDELLECNELNNVRILKRCEIALLAAPVVAVEGQASPAQAAPPAVAPQAVAPQPVNPAVPEKQDPSPLDGIDLDNLDLEDAQGTAVRLR